MTFDELYKAILEVCPHAQLDEDLDGQIVVYTDLMIDESTRCRDSKVVPYEDSDEEIPGEITRERYAQE